MQVDERREPPEGVRWTTVPDQPPATRSCDEFPFASTYEGGTGAIIRGVKVDENAQQGQDLGAFYRRNATKLAQLGGLFYVCVELEADGRHGICKGGPSYDN